MNTVACYGSVMFFPLLCPCLCPTCRSFPVLKDSMSSALFPHEQPRTPLWPPAFSSVTSSFTLPLPLLHSTTQIVLLHRLFCIAYPRASLEHYMTACLLLLANRATRPSKISYHPVPSSNNFSRRSMAQARWLYVMNNPALRERRARLPARTEAHGCHQYRLAVRPSHKKLAGSCAQQMRYAFPELHCSRTMVRPMS